MATTTTTISEKGILLADERRFWQDVEALSRTYRDKKVHAYSKKIVKWLGRAMLEVARDQMDEGDDDEMSEERLKKLIEEDKRSDADKIRDNAMMNAMLDAQWGDSPF